MGEINNAMNEYMSDSARFADFFNGVMFAGEEVIKPEQLSDASEKYDQNIVINPKTKERGKAVERIRDIKMRHIDGVCLRILGIEGQNYIDYGCGDRGAEYDIMEYRSQIKHLNSDITKTKNDLTKSEFLSGMRKEDRLIPTYTIWFYYGDESYDGPRSLSDMMHFPEDDVFRKYFSDYKINVICLNEIEDMNVFHTELRKLFKLIKYKNERDTMRELLENDNDYDTISEDTLYTMSVILEKPHLWDERDKFLRKESEVKYTMCRAFEEAEEEAENRFAELINKLLTLGKNDDAIRVTTDPEYRKELYIQYGLK